MRRRAYAGIGRGAERGATAAKLAMARELRCSPTEAEARLWDALRRRQVAGWKFRRQHVVAGYVADFYCPALRLILEVDGGVHADRAAEDAVRTADLEALGITVRRIPNEAILAHLPAVLTALRTTCARLSAPLSPGNRGKGAGG